MKTLLPYQITGRDYLRDRRSALLVDDPGLGKTAQALSALPVGGAVVVTTAPLKGMWESEAPHWTGMPVTVLSGRGSFRWPEHGEIVVVNYDILPDDPGRSPASVALVGDEIQAVKNPQADRTRKFRKLRKAVHEAGGQVWGLTGTPLFNKPPDLWGVLCAVGLQDMFGTWDMFVSAFNGRETRFGMVWGQPRPHAIPYLRGAMLGRRREDVLKDLPTKFYQTVRVDVDHEAVPKVRETEDGKNPDLSRARASLALLKAKAAGPVVAHLAEAAPLVVFTSHRQAAEAMASFLGVHPVLGGSGEADAAVRAFQDGKTDALVGTTGALGVGFTLVRSNVAVFIDRDWSPSVNEQAEDRLLRIGQTRGVRIIDVVSDHPLDAMVDRVVQRKEKIVEASVGAVKKDTP